MRITMARSGNNLGVSIRYRGSAIFGAGALLASLALAAVPAGAEELEIRADSAIVSVAPGEGGRRSLVLPTLAYSLNVSFECGPDEAPGSLSLTIADTRQTLPKSDLVDGAVVVNMEVPARQLPPLILSDFCTTEDVDSGTRFSEKHLSGILSASGSLRCDAEPGSRASYAVTSLDVTLVCETPATTEATE